MSKRQLEEPVEAAVQGMEGVATSPTLAGEVVVTGASSGIGRAIALACAEAGADLGVTYRTNRDGALDTAERARAHRRKVEAWRADVAEARDLDALGEELRRAFGRVDTWVNNAGADVLTGDA